MADGLVPNVTLTGYVGQDLVYAFTVGTRILHSTVANPTVITTGDQNGLPAPHGFRSGQTVYIRRHFGSTPSVDGAYICTVLSPTTFSVPEDVTVAGAEGFVTALTNSIGGYTYLLTIQDSDTVPTFSVSVAGTVTDPDNREFNFELPAASAATIPVSDTHKYDVWRTDTGFAHVYGDGTYVQKTERRVTPP